MVTPERVEALQAGWVRLLGGFGVGPADAYPVFDRLVAAHSEPHRHYHTLEHVAEMLKVVGRLERAATDPAVVQLAVWFHDAVYDPRAGDNEDRSARLAEEWLEQLAVRPEVIRRVAEMVRATAHLAGDAGPPDPDTAVLLDADLAILGAAELRYARYAAGIRQEYAHVPDEAYRAGRAGVLERFLARPRIYHTEMMFIEGEAAARRNLMNELAGLGGSAQTSRSGL